MVVVVKVKDKSGNNLGSFKAVKGRNIAQTANDNGIEFFSPCGAGACGFCKCKIENGAELVDIGINGVPMMKIKEDEILACVGGVQDRFVSSEEEKEIVIQKMN